MTIHLDRELLRAVFSGELPSQLIAELSMKHMLELCPLCRREAQAFKDEMTGRHPIPSGGDLVGVLQNVLKRHLASMRQRHRETERDLQALLSLPKEERIPKLKRSRRRFRGLHLVQLLLEKCEEQLTTNPADARHLAELARAVIQYSALRKGGFDYLALTVAHQANACRACGNKREADEYFEHVRYLVTHYHVTEPSILARIADLESSLRKDQRRFAQAEALLRRALTLYRAGNNARDLARVMINLGDLFHVQGLPSQAIQATEEALVKLQGEPDEQLYLMGRFNLTLQLAEAGKPEQAAALLAADEDLYRHFPGPWTQLRVSCAQGRIAEGLGELDRALEHYGQARDGFVRQGIGFDAAIVSFQMAGIYLRQGRHAELRELAEAMAVIFSAQDVHREALAALLLFQEAARAQAVTDALLIELRAYFTAARHDPDYRFRPSGE